MHIASIVAKQFSLSAMLVIGYYHEDSFYYLKYNVSVALAKTHYHVKTRVSACSQQHWHADIQ